MSEIPEDVAAATEDLLFELVDRGDAEFLGLDDDGESRFRLTAQGLSHADQLMTRGAEHDDAGPEASPDA
jgi:hypothetical protein